MATVFEQGDGPSIRLLILAQGMVYDLDNNTATEGGLTLRLHRDWILPDDTDESYTSAWRWRRGGLTVVAGQGQTQLAAP